MKYMEAFVGREEGGTSRFWRGHTKVECLKSLERRSGM